MMISMKLVQGALIGLAAVGLLAGCSQGSVASESVVFTIARDPHLSGVVAPNEILDVGLPQLFNLSGNAVKLTRVTIATNNPAARVRYVAAFRYGWPFKNLRVARGNLLACRARGQSYPLTDVVTAANSDSGWYIVIGLSFSKPGHYSLGPAKIYFYTHGHHRWQFQNMSTVVTVSAKPGKSSPVGCA